METILCPFCGTEMVDLGNGKVKCPNQDCRCPDGGQSLYEKPKPKNWIEWKRAMLNE